MDQHRRSGDIDPFLTALKMDPGFLNPPTSTRSQVEEYLAHLELAFQIEFRRSGGRRYPVIGLALQRWRREAEKHQWLDDVGEIDIAQELANRGLLVKS